MTQKGDDEMRNIIIYAHVILFILSGTSYVSCQDEVSKQETAQASPKAIVTAVGREVSITLLSNRTTGYAWQLSEQPDKNVLEFLNSEYLAGDLNMPGQGGKEIWTFKAISRGKIKIVFHYLRSWEKDVPPVQTETYSIDIE